MSNAKADKLTLKKRVEEILQMRLLGAEFTDIKAHAQQQEWKVSERQLWRYIARGDKLLAATLEIDRGKLLNKHLAQRRALYARAVAASDYAAAIRILKDECDLLGLYPQKKDAKEDGMTFNGPVQINGQPIDISAILDSHADAIRAATRREIDYRRDTEPFDGDGVREPIHPDH